MRYIALGWMLVFPMQLFGEDSRELVPTDEALRTIEELEKNWERASFRCEVTRGKLANLDDVRSLVPDPTFVRTTVTVEPLAQRARVDLTGVFPWMHGTHPYMAMTAAYGYGEALFRKWEIQTGGVEVPPVGSRGVGEIGPEDGDRFAELKSMSGLAMFPPFFLHQPLSQGLRSVVERGKRLEVFRNPDGSWQIDTFEFDLDDPLWEDEHRILIDYDPTTGGVVTGALWTEPLPDRPHESKPWKRLHVELIDLGQGIRAPRDVALVNLLDRSTRRWHFTDVRRNPDIDPAVYRLDFPHNIHVTDHIHNKMYLVGSGLENDQRAVQAFIERYQLADDDRSRVGWWWGALGLVSLGLIGAGGFVLHRRMRMSRR